MVYQVYTLAFLKFKPARSLDRRPSCRSGLDAILAPGSKQVGISNPRLDTLTQP